MRSLFAGFVVVTTLAAGCGGGASPGGTGGAGGKVTGSGGAGGSGGVTGSGGSAGSGGASGSGGLGGGSGGTSGSGGGSGGSGGAGGGSGGTTDGGSTTDGGNDARDAAVESGGSDVAALAPQLPAGGRCVPGMVYPAVMAASPQPTMVRAGFSFLEGPLWMASQNALYFSDFTLSAADGLPGRMHKYTPATNAFEIFLPTPATNGLAVDADGMIVAASHQDRKLIRINPTTKQITDVVGGAMFGGMPFNCLNDVVIRNDGNMYFSDPSYQRGNRPGQPDTSYFRMAPNGTVTRIGARTQPNGVSLSPDGQYLYVASAEDNGGGIRRHPVNADGSLGAATNFSPEISDGMAVDCAGNLYLNARSRVQVVSPAGQNVVTITGFSTANGNFVTNAAFGGPAGKTLYVTTSNILYSVEMNIPGLPN